MAAYYEDVYRVVERIPVGKVSTYGRIAALITVPRGARGVGWALHALKPEAHRNVPWWRVINAAGRISNEYNADLQRQMLEAEGVVFDECGYVDLKRFLCDNIDLSDVSSR
ncbi:MAG: methylated-DNA--protein-cysteine methyltransferase [Chloroflexi bacterium AL-W]|nr:methylated-DNA--protein-cysteine methyltransferase [Chloroflexi bacterium AL-N1]NOK65625.1 methylated-DNA--protein-cysteine methyltransferase [Chloroflexi bacterium AL-N10]NOK74434.1 methylated-DNA--protein-cysteine methyltransferase [Chloroflexi bacterium AL-N5]NOK80658.1 methylated-DNA--protein-cysteine methyltransferase [Chloroflexi bacterium AL-W]NOK88692.1 methylated-DNA--protein-cysteine methyltransferase [Chloroflexi bacterium AL-N15]